MNSINFRIRKIIGDNSIKNGYDKQSQKDFANRLGIELSTLTHIFEEHNEPALDVIERILLAFPTINPDWLILDIEPMYRETVMQNSKKICEPSAYSLYENEKNQLLFEKVSEAENWEWTPEFIEKYKEQLNWKALSYNYELPWSKELVDQYLEKWDWRGITCIIANMKNNSSSKSSQHFSIYILRNYADKLDWRILCKENNFDEKYFSKYAKKIDWNIISANPKLIWNRRFLETHCKQINWQILSENSFFGNLNSRQEAFRAKILHLYGDRLDLFLLSGNYDLLFTPEIIEKYKEKWDWHEMINNFRIEWTLEMFEKYDEYISRAVSPDELRNSHLVYLLMKNELQKYGLRI